MEREEEMGTSSGERRSDSKKRDEEKDRYTGHEACAGIYSTAPDLFEGFGWRISRTPVDSFLYPKVAQPWTEPPFWFLLSAGYVVTFGFEV